jgi:hypothetical protein
MLPEIFALNDWGNPRKVVGFSVTWLKFEPGTSEFSTFLSQIARSPCNN